MLPSTLIYMLFKNRRANCVYANTVCSSICKQRKQYIYTYIYISRAHLRVGVDDVGSDGVSESEVARRGHHQVEQQRQQRSEEHHGSLARRGGTLELAAKKIAAQTHTHTTHQHIDTVCDLSLTQTSG